MSTRRVELVVGDGSTLHFVCGVEPNICNLATIFEDVVRDRQVVGTDLVGVVAVVVRRPLCHDTRTTINEVVAVDDVSIATRQNDTDVIEVDGVVQLGVALVVNEGVVGQLEEVQFVVVVVSVAHCTDD